MLNKIASAGQTTLSGKNLTGKRNDTSSQKKKPQTQPKAKNVATNALFDDALKSAINKQSRMNSGVLNKIHGNFFRSAITQYEKNQQITKEPPTESIYKIIV